MCIYVDDSHQSATFLRTKLCECVFAGFFYTCSYKCLWLFVWVHLFCWAVEPWAVFVCHGKRQRKRVNVVVLCLCVLASVWRFDGGVEPPRANGDTAVAIYPNTSQEFTGRITRKDERRGEQHHQKLLGEIFLASLSVFWKKGALHFKFSLQICRICTSVCAGSLSCVSNSFQDGVQEFRTWMWYLARLC